MRRPKRPMLFVFRAGPDPVLERLDFLVGERFTSGRHTLRVIGSSYTLNKRALFHLTGHDRAHAGIELNERPLGLIETQTTFLFRWAVATEAPPGEDWLDVANKTNALCSAHIEPQQCDGQAHRN